MVYQIDCLTKKLLMVVKGLFTKLNTSIRTYKEEKCLKSKLYCIQNLL